MIEQPATNLVQLRPRSDTVAVSQGRTVLTTDRDGFITDGAERGLFVHETRLLSRYRYWIDDQVPRPNACSNVEQHSWLGYYIMLPPGPNSGKEDQGSRQVPQASEHTLELRLSRYIGGGVHEDVDLTNFTQKPTAFRLELEVAADFADQSETRGARQQHGELTSSWCQAGTDAWELTFDYRAEHTYDQQGNQGTASINRAVTLRVEHATSAPSYRDGRIAFQVDLDPHESWHACISIIPCIDGVVMQPGYSCRSFAGTHNEQDRARAIFLHEATSFTTPGSDTLAPVVVGALEQARRDLAALRLDDLDHGERA